MTAPNCRFPHNPPVEAEYRVTLSDGCACYPNDREQALCAQHAHDVEPLGDAIIRPIDGRPPLVLALRKGGSRT